MSASPPPYLPPEIYRMLTHHQELIIHDQIWPELPLFEANSKSLFATLLLTGIDCDEKRRPQFYQGALFTLYDVQDFRMDAKRFHNFYQKGRFARNLAFTPVGTLPLYRAAYSHFGKYVKCRYSLALIAKAKPDLYNPFLLSEEAEKQIDGWLFEAIIGQCK